MIQIPPPSAPSGVSPARPAHGAPSPPPVCCREDQAFLCGFFLRSEGSLLPLTPNLS